MPLSVVTKKKSNFQWKNCNKPKTGVTIIMKKYNTKDKNVEKSKQKEKYHDIDRQEQQRERGRECA